MLKRRHLLVATAGAALAGVRPLFAGSPRALGAPAEPKEGNTVTVRLTAAERPTALPCFSGASLPLWTFAEGAWPPVIRLSLGDRLAATLENRLSRDGETISIHWHGIRLPNDQDGVPYLIQAPVAPGGDFFYHFTPPDTGTYWFHTHCDTVEQLGRGLEGVLIIDGDTTEPYDSDVVLVLRDWRVEPGTAEFAAFTTVRGAGRAGTYGPLRTVNGSVNPEIPLPAKGDCRLRLLNTDPTRIMQIAIAGTEAAIVAVDGVATQPFPMQQWYLGPGMRIDVIARAPAAGKLARLTDASGGTHVDLARFRGVPVASGRKPRAASFDPAPLRAGRMPAPDLKAETRISFRFGATDAGAASGALEENFGAALGTLCVTSRNFWTINGKPWPDRDHARLPAPLATLTRGQSYVFTFVNETDFVHPIHMHGHSFTFLRASKLKRPPHHTDTLLLLPREEADVAFVADNPGDWMMHCHVIEHQENGMMGFVRVA